MGDGTAVWELERIIRELGVGGLGAFGCGKYWDKCCSQWENFVGKFLGLFLSTVSTGYHVYHFFFFYFIKRENYIYFILFGVVAGDCGKDYLCPHKK